jgi:hypothetical protein
MAYLIQNKIKGLSISDADASGYHWILFQANFKQAFIWQWGSSNTLSKYFSHPMLEGMRG